MGDVIQITEAALPESWIEKIFDRMLLSFGKKFTDQWSGSDPQKLIDFWAEQLSGFTGQEVKRGLAAMEGMDWPPSLPQFKKLCRPPVDAMVAYYEAVAGAQARQKGEAGVWSHPAIFWAAAPLSFDLLSQTFSNIKSRWERALAEQMEKGEWAPIPAAMAALPAPGKADLSREKAAAMLHELGASEVLKPKRDHKFWAKRIVADEKRKPGTWPSYSVRCANEALAASSV